MVILKRRRAASHLANIHSSPTRRGEGESQLFLPPLCARHSAITVFEHLLCTRLLGRGAQIRCLFPFSPLSNSVPLIVQTREQGWKSEVIARAHPAGVSALEPDPFARWWSHPPSLCSSAGRRCHPSSLPLSIPPALWLSPDIALLRENCPDSSLLL